MHKRVGAVVLAAGMSTRMGRLKQLLPYDGKTVVETVVSRLREAGLTSIVVVVGHRADEVRAAVGDSARCALNAHYADGMLSSVLTGLDALEPSTHGMLLALGDQPQIAPAVAAAVLKRFQETDRGIVIPETAGRRGHPIVIDVDRYGDAIRGLDGSEGLKPIVRGHPEDTEIVKVDAGAILRDLDTPEDYERELRLLESERGDHG